MPLDFGSLRRHPDVEGHATASLEAFHEVWVPKGWVHAADLGTSREAPDISADQLSVLTGEAYNDLTKDELKVLAVERGLDDSGTKNEIAARLTEAAYPGGSA